MPRDASSTGSGMPRAADAAQAKEEAHPTGPNPSCAIPGKFSGAAAPAFETKLSCGRVTTIPRAIPVLRPFYGLTLN